MTASFINTSLLIAAALACLSILASPLGARVGIPILLVFLGVGMLAGEDGPGGILFTSYHVAYLVGNIALAIILLDGGFRTRKASFRVGLWPSLSLATFGVLIATTLSGLAASYLFNVNWIEGLLIGAIVSSTDAAAVFSLLSGRRINQRVSSTLEIESGSNDPMAVFLTVALIGILEKPENLSFTSLTWHFLSDFSIGLVMGLSGAWLLCRLINWLKLAPGLYSLLIVSSGLVIFSLTNKLGGSGFLAVYAAGIWLGNHPIRSKHNILSLLDSLTWIAQIGMFVILGLLVTPIKLIPIAFSALCLALWMIFIARPISVWLSLVFFKTFHWREKTFISWVGLKGAVPIVLGIYPLMSGLPNAQLYFNVAFFVVMVSLILQGSTIPVVSKWLDIMLPRTAKPQKRIGLEIYPTSSWELFVYELSQEKWCIGEPLHVLRMPKGTKVAAVFRDRVLMQNDDEIILEPGDHLCVIGHESDIPKLSQLFTKSALYDRDDRFYGDFILEGGAPLDAVIDLYGFPRENENPHMTLADLMQTKIKGKAVIGDKIEWKNHQWTVAALNAQNEITKIGIKLSKS